MATTRVTTDALPDYNQAFADIYDEMRVDLCSFETDIASFLRQARPAAGQTVLDWGCGTGLHARELGGRGHPVIGLDVSPAMAEKAEANTRDRAAVRILSRDVVEWAGSETETRIGAFYSFANVINCLPDEATMEQSLRAIASLLPAGGRGMVDAWNILPLLKNGPRETIRHVATPGAEFVQTMAASLERERQVLNIDYRVFVSRDGGACWRQVRSTHRLTLRTPRQYHGLFERAGFAVLEMLVQRPRSDTRAGDDDRLVTFVLERV